MRLLTHNTLRNNTAEASGGGFPLKITATEVRVDDSSDVGEDSEREIMFVKSVLEILDWPALVKVSCFRIYFFQLITYAIFGANFPNLCWILRGHVKWDSLRCLRH